MPLLVHVIIKLELYTSLQGSCSGGMLLSEISQWGRKNYTQKKRGEFNNFRTNPPWNFRCFCVSSSISLMGLNFEI